MKKGRNRAGAGGFQKLPNGKTRHVRQIQGRRLFGPSADTQAEALRLFDQKLARIRAKTKPKPDDALTVSQYFFHLIESGTLRSELAPNTAAKYETVYEHSLRPSALAVLPMDSVQPGQIAAWLRTVDGQPRTKAAYLSVLSGVFRRAMDAGLIPSNPCRTIKAPKPAPHRKRILTPEEVGQLLALDLPPRVRLAVLFGLEGLRRSEICGVRFDDYQDGGINVCRQVQDPGGRLGIRDMTKNGKDRWVPVGKELKALLAKGSEGFVLQSEGGGPYRPSNLYRDWRKAIAGTAFEGLDLHELRATAGMAYLVAGVDVRTAAEILGHDPSVLLREYARSSSALKVAARKKIARARGA